MLSHAPARIGRFKAPVERGSLEIALTVSVSRNLSRLLCARLKHASRSLFEENKYSSISAERLELLINVGGRLEDVKPLRADKLTARNVFDARVLSCRLLREMLFR